MRSGRFAGVIVALVCVGGSASASGPSGFERDLALASSPIVGSVEGPLSEYVAFEAVSSELSTPPFVEQVVPTPGTALLLIMGGGLTMRRVAFGSRKAREALAVVREPVAGAALA